MRYWLWHFFYFYKNSLYEFVVKSLHQTLPKLRFELLRWTTSLDKTINTFSFCRLRKLFQGIREVREA